MDFAVAFVWPFTPRLATAGSFSIISMPTVYTWTSLTMELSDYISCVIITIFMMTWVETMNNISLLVKGISSSAYGPSCWRLKVFWAATARKIELGKAWIHLCLTKSSLTPILLAVAINFCKKYDGLPVILISPISRTKSSGFVCSVAVTDLFPFANQCPHQAIRL